MNTRTDQPVQHSSLTTNNNNFVPSSTAIAPQKYVSNVNPAGVMSDTKFQTIGPGVPQTDEIMNVVDDSNNPGRFRMIRVDRSFGRGRWKINDYEPPADLNDSDGVNTTNLPAPLTNNDGKITTMSSIPLTNSSTGTSNVDNTAMSTAATAAAAAAAAASQRLSATQATANMPPPGLIFPPSMTIPNLQNQSLFVPNLSYFPPGFGGFYHPQYPFANPQYAQWAAAMAASQAQMGLNPSTSMPTYLPLNPTANLNDNIRQHLDANFTVPDHNGDISSNNLYNTSDAMNNSQFAQYLFGQQFSSPVPNQYSFPQQQQLINQLLTNNSMTTNEMNALSTEQQRQTNPEVFQQKLNVSEQAKSVLTSPSKKENDNSQQQQQQQQQQSNSLTNTNQFSTIKNLIQSLPTTALDSRTNGQQSNDKSMSEIPTKILDESTGNMSTSSTVTPQHILSPVMTVPQFRSSQNVTPTTLNNIWNMTTTPLSLSQKAQTAAATAAVAMELLNVGTGNESKNQEIANEILKELTTPTKQHKLIRQLSTTDIDNKISAAMDLVKMHLLSAVREEVVDLRQQIKALHEKLSLCELERDYLRLHVPSEILAQFNSTINSNSNNNNSNIDGSVPSNMTITNSIGTPITNSIITPASQLSSLPLSSSTTAPLPPSSLNSALQNT
ncbi:unnamed protein product [Didymodactylos carnosus]|uniref:Uncharacterized protein n=1 Tax=Didymodactylos carnosus TaxID=1234261 RepID=A0A813TPB3_9BILA|nr:unnamed protein product [Didymodactylos carnosus]CAF0928827.1 unnamed protein product [Didymodactylos carnosus]CAF3597964.1 unnamed protein product [Didymodactylos carnosus]CAF3705686.1 unnamed protein product [Didymodactylos carnosus]